MNSALLLLFIMVIYIKWFVEVAFVQLGMI